MGSRWELLFTIKLIGVSNNERLLEDNRVRELY